MMQRLKVMMRCTLDSVQVYTQYKQSKRLSILISFPFLGCGRNYAIPHTKHLAENSNIGVPGVYAYRIDEEKIIDHNSGKKRSTFVK